MQLITGSNNNTAGRDNNTAGRDVNTAGRDVHNTHIYSFNPHPIRFYENDIKEIVECFVEELDVIGNIIQETNDFYRPHIEIKNEINNLSDGCFEHIKKESMAYFDKIDAFLSDRRNEEFLKKYLSTAKEINNKIVCNRSEFNYFEKIFDAIYNYIVDRANYQFAFDRELIWVFLHFMYYNCDIGEKYDTTT